MSYADATYDVKVAAGSTTAAITFGPQGRGVSWIVSQISIAMPLASVGSACVLTKKGAFITYLISTGDVAGGDPPIVLNNQETLQVTWSGVSAGLIGTAFVIYDETRNR